MPNVALIPHRSPRVEALSAVVDGYPDESHKVNLFMGEEPIEDGSPVTDHAVALREEVTLTGWVSNISMAGDQYRPHDAWTRIRELAHDLKVVSLVTAFGMYPEMIIIQAEADAVGGGMRFTLKLAQVIRVGVLPGEIGEGAIGPAEDRTSEVLRGKVLSTVAAPVMISPLTQLQQRIAIEDELVENKSEILKIREQLLGLASTATDTRVSLLSRRDDLLVQRASLVTRVRNLISGTDDVLRTPSDVIGDIPDLWSF